MCSKFPNLMCSILAAQNKNVQCYGAHLIDFGPKLSAVIDRYSPFLANQSASKG